MTNPRSASEAYVKIIEQPHSTARFRYVCETSGGLIVGKSSTSENRTYPEVEICGYQGDALVVVSCVTRDPPYLQHPHKLVGSNCKHGVCVVSISPNTNMRYTFQKMKIQCVKKKEIPESLAERARIRVDPFKNGYTHSRVTTPNLVDLNSLRLCFQCFLRQVINGILVTTPLKPVVSDVVSAKKSMMALSIVELSSCVGRADGGEKILLFCEKVDKNDIMIHFFEEDAEGLRFWQANAEFYPSNVHKQSGISFKTPPYHNQFIEEPVKVYMQLYRPSDKAEGSPVLFEYFPIINSATMLIDNACKRKRFDIDESSRTIIKRIPEPERRVMNNIIEMSLIEKNAQSTSNTQSNPIFEGSPNLDYCGLYPIPVQGAPPATPSHKPENNNIQNQNLGYSESHPAAAKAPTFAQNKNGQDDIRNAGSPFWNFNLDSLDGNSTWMVVNANNINNAPTDQNPYEDLAAHSINSDVLINQMGVFNGIDLMDFNSLSLTDL